MAKRVLVVEDNELNLKLFCDLLRAHQFEAEPVRDGREAVARARDFDPQLVVMDIQMPHITGLEIIQHMKLDPRLRTIPIMAVTAYSGRDDEERIRAAGANAYVSKPISLVRFMEEVRALMPAESAAPPAAAPEAPAPAPEAEAPAPATGTEEAPQPKGPGLLF